MLAQRPGGMPAAALTSTKWPPPVLRKSRSPPRAAATKGWGQPTVAQSETTAPGAARLPSVGRRSRRAVLPREPRPAVARGDAQDRRRLEGRADAVGARAAHEQADAGRVAVGVGGAPGHAVDTQLGLLDRGEER